MDNISGEKSTNSNDSAKLAHEQKVINVIEEFATVQSEVVETGKVRITKTVTEEASSIYVPIINESYQVRHIPVVSRIFDEPPAALTQSGDTTIIKVLREISVIVKKYELIEEIHITKQVTQTPLTHEVILRKENVKIERSST